MSSGCRVEEADFGCRVSAFAEQGPTARVERRATDDVMARVAERVKNGCL